jgi:hypothetical protein
MKKAVIILAGGFFVTGCNNDPLDGVTGADIGSFIFEAANNDALDNDITGTIDGTEIAANVPYGTDVTALVPTVTIAEGASVVPASGEAKDFTDPVTYTVTAPDGETAAEYTVTVSIATADAGTACDITGFVFAAADNGELSSDVTGTIGTGTVDASVPFGTDRSALVPTITCSSGASVAPASGEAQDFSSAVTYTVTAEDAATTQEYTVTVTEAAFQEVDNTFDPDTVVQQLEHGNINSANDYFGGNNLMLEPNNCTAFSADGSTLVIGARLWHDSGGNSVGSAFVFEYDAGSWQQTARLEGSKAEHGDAFGNSVAISRDGSVIAVGAFDDEMSSPTGTGLVYVYERNGESWSNTTEDAILSASNAASGHEFGCSVGVSGDGSVIAAGARYATDTGDVEGQGYVFLRPAGGWADWTGGDTEHARLEMSMLDTSAYMAQSIAVSLDGSLVVAGAPFHADQFADDGMAFIFEEPAGGWDENSPLVTVVNETAQLTGSTPSDYLYLAESKIAITDDKSVIALGCPRYSGSHTYDGAVFIYRRSGSWADATEDEIVTADDPAPNDYFGISLSLTAQGGYLLVGAEGDDLDGTNKGSAYLYELDSGNYTLSTTKFREPSIVGNGALYGQSVALSPDGSTLCVTAPGWDSAGYTDQGTAFIYQ